MVAVVGFAMIICIVALLLKGKMSPIVVLTVIPAVAALILGHGPVEIADFIKEGVKTTTNNGILFIFSVIYFGVMSDTGMFDVIVNFLVKKAGNNVIAVTVATAIIATIAHLDGTTATTVLITIPARYPVYEYIGEHYAIAFVADPQRNHVFPGRRVDFGIHIHPSASDNGEVTAEIGCCRLSPVAPDAYQGIGNRFRSQQLLDTRGGPGNIQSLLFLQFL